MKPLLNSLGFVFLMFIHAYGTYKLKWKIEGEENNEWFHVYVIKFEYLLCAKDWKLGHNISVYKKISKSSSKLRGCWSWLIIWAYINL